MFAESITPIESQKDHNLEQSEESEFLADQSLAICDCAPAETEADGQSADHLPAVMPAEEDIWGNSYLEQLDGIPSEAGVSAVTEVKRLRISEDSPPQVLVKFGHQPLIYEGHNLQAEGDIFPRYYKCLGADCPACRAGIKKAIRQVEFFYHPADREIVYYTFSQDKKPDSFHQQLVQNCRGGFPALLLISKDDRYTVRILRMQDQTSIDYGLPVIREFSEDYHGGKVGLHQIVPEISAAEMSKIQAVVNILIAKGLVS